MLQIKTVCWVMTFIILTCVSVQGTEDLPPDGQAANVQSTQSLLLHMMSTVSDLTTNETPTFEITDAVTESGPDGGEEINASRDQIEGGIDLSGDQDVQSFSGHQQGVGQSGDQDVQSFSGHQQRVELSEDEEVQLFSGDKQEVPSEETGTASELFEAKLLPFGPNCMVPRDLYKQLTERTDSTSLLFASFYMLPDGDNSSYSLDKKLGLHKNMKCPTTTTYTSDIEERSLCPWYYDIHYDSNRYPKHIKTAKCMKCRGCDHNSGMLAAYRGQTVCESVAYTIQVLKKDRCHRGVYLYRLDDFVVSVGCVCAMFRT